MDAEPQVESLMQLLNDALNELDNLDARLTGYDTLLRVSEISSKTVQMYNLSEWYSTVYNSLHSLRNSRRFTKSPHEPSQNDV